MSSKALATRAAALKAAKDHEANPLDMVPDAYLKSTVDLYFRRHYFLQNPLSLAAQLGDWIDEEGLTPEEWSAVVRKASRPERQAGLDTCPKFMADLAALVAEAVKYRERQQRDQRQLDEVRAGPVDPAVREALRRTGLVNTQPAR